MNIQTDEHLALGWARNPLVFKLPRWGWVVVVVAIAAIGHFV